VPARPATPPEPAAELFVTDHRQYRSQVLVVSDGALIDLANLVEGAVGEFDGGGRLAGLDLRRGGLHLKTSH